MAFYTKVWHIFLNLNLILPLWDLNVKSLSKLTGIRCLAQGDHVWFSIKDVKDFDVPIGAVVKSVDGLGMLLIDDQGEVRMLAKFLLTGVN